MIHHKMVHHIGVTLFSAGEAKFFWAWAGPDVDQSIQRDRATAPSHDARCPDAWCHSMAWSQTFQNPLSNLESGIRGPRHSGLTAITPTQGPPRAKNENLHGTHRGTTSEPEHLNPSTKDVHEA